MYTGETTAINLEAGLAWTFAQMSTTQDVAALVWTVAKIKSFQ